MSEFFKALMTKWFLESKPQKPRLTEDELMVRLKFLIGVCLAFTLVGIVFVVLYSLIFVTQPLNAISPIDQKFFELVVPIATFLTGTLSGIMLAGKDPNSASTTPVAPKPEPKKIEVDEEEIG